MNIKFRGGLLRLKDFLSTVKVTTAGYGFYWCESVDVSTVSSNDVKTVDVKGMVNKEEPKSVKKNNFSPPIIEDWVSESEEEYEPKFQKQVQPSFPKIEFVKAKDQNQSFRKPIQVSNGLGIEKSLTPQLKIGTSSRRSLGEEDTSKHGRIMKYEKQRSIFEERDFDEILMFKL
nr:hypothetical protein [Tanacetum cinerariifolium]